MATQVMPWEEAAQAQAHVAQQETFSNVQPIPETFTNVQPIQQQMPWEEAAQQRANTITGISAAPKPTGIMDRISKWTDNVSNDIKYGTDTTGIGTVLKKMGAHGVYSGTPEAVGDYMASLPLGLLQGTKGAAQIGQGQVIQGAGNVVGGALKAGTIPASVMAPQASSEGAAALENAIPSVERAGRTFQELKGAIGNHTVGMTNELSDAITGIKELIDTGASTPQVINKFVSRIADTNEGPLTYAEARNFYSNATKLTATDKMSTNPAMKRAISIFTSRLGDAIENTAGLAGKLDDLQGAMSEYSNAMRMRELGSNALEIGKKAAITAGTGALLGTGGAAAYRTYKDLFGP